VCTGLLSSAGPSAPLDSQLHRETYVLLSCLQSAALRATSKAVAARYLHLALLLLTFAACTATFKASERPWIGVHVAVLCMITLCTVVAKPLLVLAALGAVWVACFVCLSIQADGSDKGPRAAVTVALLVSSAASYTMLSDWRRRYPLVETAHPCAHISRVCPC
jgi:hypothetical protein